MEKIIKINQLYFEEKKNLTEISKILNVSVAYVSKILMKNENYKLEKEIRKQKNLHQRKKQQKDLIYKNRKNKIDIEAICVKRQHEQAAIELSKHSTLGKDTLRKWCSAYKYNPNKKCYEFDTKNVLKPVDFPLRIKA